MRSRRRREQRGVSFDDDVRVGTTRGAKGMLASGMDQKGRASKKGSERVAPSFRASAHPSSHVGTRALRAHTQRYWFTHTGLHTHVCTCTYAFKCVPRVHDPARLV